MSSEILTIRWLGNQPYLTTWQAMRTFTDQRHEQTPDEIWLLEHPPVYTQGQNGQAKHLLNPGTIPVVASDRGGQITYHGPGQLVAYTLIDIKRKKMGIRSFVSALESAIIDLLAQLDIPAHTTCNAPGVYVGDKKICSLGLRVRRGLTYHGLALNVNMDLDPFNKINPCGFADLAMTQLAEFNPAQTVTETGSQLIKALMKSLVYRDYNYILDPIIA